MNQFETRLRDVTFANNNEEEVYHGSVMRPSRLFGEKNINLKLKHSKITKGCPAEYISTIVDLSSGS